MVKISALLLIFCICVLQVSADRNKKSDQIHLMMGNPDQYLELTPQEEDQLKNDHSNITKFPHKSVPDYKKKFHEYQKALLECSFYESEKLKEYCQEKNKLLREELDRIENKIVQFQGALNSTLDILQCLPRLQCSKRPIPTNQMTIETYILAKLQRCINSFQLNLKKYEIPKCYDKIKLFTAYHCDIVDDYPACEALRQDKIFIKEIINLVQNGMTE